MARSSAAASGASGLGAQDRHEFADGAVGGRVSDHVDQRRSLDHGDAKQTFGHTTDRGCLQRVAEIVNDRA